MDKVKTVCVGILLGVNAVEPASEPFQVDYCSFVHSQHVLDRVNSEVRPIFETYDLKMIEDGQICSLNNFGMIEDHVR